ncbi:carbohydrate ABC transporter permease [Nonomuraea sp. KM90]|uniref:carbohydrate ABC transporter permease n=1 Tax=Nonomuraea sp. KM90 TaxID=3457428 RepID=UPI003FCE844B
MYAGIAVWVWKWLGITLIYRLAAPQTIPQGVHEAAMIDGAGAWAEFGHVRMPLLVPFLVIITLIDTVAAFNVFDLMRTLTGGGPCAARVRRQHRGSGAAMTRTESS